MSALAASTVTREHGTDAALTTPEAIVARANAADLAEREAGDHETYPNNHASRCPT
jgi:hypothetical protein